MKEVSELIIFDQFMHQKRYSQNTIKTYTEALNIFREFYAVKELSEITNADIERFNFEYIIRNGYSSSYQNQIINALKLYYGRFHSLNIDSQRMVVFIQGAKGKKDRYVPLSETALVLTRDYYRAFRPKEYLFNGEGSLKYSPTSLRKGFHRARKKAGITKQATLHTLRHSYATHPNAKYPVIYLMDGDHNFYHTVGLAYTFKQFPDENHNSVGLTTVSHALKQLFKSYNPAKKEVDTCESFADFERLISETSDKVGEGYLIANSAFQKFISSEFAKDPKGLDSIEERIKERYSSSLGDFYALKGSSYFRSGDSKTALEIYLLNVELHPENPDFLVDLAEVYDELKDADKVIEYYEKAYALAQQVGARQWVLNELKSKVEQGK